jgi:hypothetical protein
MIKNVKIWIGENNEEYSRKAQEYLFSQGVTWNGKFNKGTDVNWVKCSALFVVHDGNLMHGDFDKSFFDSLSSYEEMKLIESYHLEEVKQRETICVGEKNYYIDELEVALRNIKHI